jgi:hypothetical protein
MAAITSCVAHPLPLRAIDFDPIVKTFAATIRGPPGILHTHLTVGRLGPFTAHTFRVTFSRPERAILLLP